MMTRANKPIRNGAAFTLMELLVALAMFAMLASAIYTVFSSAIRLREKGFQVIERQLPASAVLDIMRRDIQGAMTTGTLAGPMIGIANNTGQGSSDQLEFYTTSGMLSDRLDSPWNELQRVTYQLEGAQTNTGAQGMELVREVQRNMLSPTEDEPSRQRLLDGIKSFRVDYFYDQTWINTWDSTNNGIPPQVLKVRIDFMPPTDEQKGPTRHPLLLVVEPITRVVNTTSTLGNIDLAPETIAEQQGTTL